MNYRNIGVYFLIFLFVTIILAFQNITQKPVLLLSKTEIKLENTAIWEKLSSEEKPFKELEHINQLKFFKISYKSDDVVVNGLLIEPKQNGVYPVVIFNRGGNRDFAPLNLETLINYTSRIAAEGFVIIGSNYRDKDEFGGKDLNDVLNLFDVLNEIPKANSNCVGMFGWSRGGMMTYLRLANSDRIKTAVVGNGPSNMLEIANARPVLETKVLAECIPNYYENKEAELKKRSSVFWPEKLCKSSSLLILSGLKDNRQNPEQAKVFAKKLDSLNYNYVLKEVETDHFFSDQKPLLQTTLVNWFNEHLKPCE